MASTLGNVQYDHFLCNGRLGGIKFIENINLCCFAVCLILVFFKDTLPI